MVPPDPVVSAQDVLQAFRRDAPDLFLGAAFITVGLVAIAFSALSKKRDALLIYFGIFAALYGLRLWIQPRVFGIALAAAYLRCDVTWSRRAKNFTPTMPARKPPTCAEKAAPPPPLNRASLANVLFA